MSKKQSGNTAKYRKAKRVTSFVHEPTKRAILKAAKENGHSVSTEIAQLLEATYK